MGEIWLRWWNALFIQIPKMLFRYGVKSRVVRSRLGAWHWEIEIIETSWFLEVLMCDGNWWYMSLDHSLVPRSQAQQPWPSRKHVGNTSLGWAVVTYLVFPEKVWETDPLTAEIAYTALTQSNTVSMKFCDYMCGFAHVHVHPRTRAHTHIINIHDSYRFVTFVQAQRIVLRKL